MFASKYQSEESLLFQCFFADTCTCTHDVHVQNEWSDIAMLLTNMNNVIDMVIRVMNLEMCLGLFTMFHPKFFLPPQ